MYAFNYVRPASIDEAMQALALEEAQPISGGQTLIPTLKQRLAMPSQLVDLSGLPELKGIEDKGDALLIRGATTHAAVAGSEVVQGAIPALAYLAGHIGDPQVRNRGTIGGSVANNDPAACYPAAVLALKGVVLTSHGEIAADDYFQGMFATALEEGGIVAGVRFAKPARAAYEKFLQPASRFALTAVFVARYADGVRVAVTGASQNGVFRWAEAEQALSENFAPEAVAGLSVDPSGMIADIHGSQAYRAHLVQVMTRRAVAKA